MHEQVAFGQEAGEQHTVPVLVGDLADQVVGGLRALTPGHSPGGRWEKVVAQGAAMGAQAYPQLLLGLAEMRRHFPETDCEGLQGFAGPGFGFGARLGDGVFQTAAVFAGEGEGHCGRLC